MTDPLDSYLDILRLPYTRQHYAALSGLAGERSWSCIDYLENLIQGEIEERNTRAIQRRIAAARFPAIKSLENFQWSWPKTIDREKVQSLFRFGFLTGELPSNIILVGNVGLGKTHLSIALGHTACLRGHSVLFTTAVDIHQYLGRRPVQWAPQTGTRSLPQTCRPHHRRIGVSAHRQTRCRPSVPDHQPAL
nr:ATP-binding protein [Ferrovum sp.]